MITTEQAEANPKEYLGRDLKMYDDDIKFSGNNDFAFTFGNENLSQAIKMRLLSTVGVLTRHTLYGSELPDLIHYPKTDTTLYKIQQAIYSTLLQESRIEDVVEIKVYYNIDYNVVCEIEVKPIYSEDNLNLIYNLFD